MVALRRVKSHDALTRRHGDGPFLDRPIRFPCYESIAADYDDFKSQMMRARLYKCSYFRLPLSVHYHYGAAPSCQGIGWWLLRRCKRLIYRGLREAGIILYAIRAEPPR